MATENPVKHGPFGDVADKNPERKVSYGDTGTNAVHNWGAHPAHTETAHPVKGDNFSKKP
jgi:hypothetical protein